MDETVRALHIPSVSLRILVVDDNADSAETMAVFLERLGHDVRKASDGLEALDVADAFHPEMAMLDIALPKLDGHEVALRLRQRPWAKNLSLIAVTGWGRESDRQRSRSLGFDDHLIKPADLQRVRQLLDAAAASRVPQPHAG